MRVIKLLLGIFEKRMQADAEWIAEAMAVYTTYRPEVACQLPSQE